MCNGKLISSIPCGLSRVNCCPKNIMASTIHTINSVIATSFLFHSKSALGCSDELINCSFKITTCSLVRNYAAFSGNECRHL